MKKRNILCLFSISVILSALMIFSISNAYSQKSAVEAQRELSRKSVDEVKNRINKLKKELIEKNKKYRVEQLEITKYKISQITGLKTPKNLSTDAKVQSEFGESLYRDFMKRLNRKSELDRRFFFNQGEEESTNKKDENIKKIEPESSDKIADEKNADQKIADSELANKDTVPTPTPKPIPAPIPVPVAPDPSLKSFSWKEKGMMTPVKYQGTCGSCWTFTSAAVLEASIKIIYNIETDISEQNILDCARAKSGIDAGSCEGGWYGYVFEHYTAKPLVAEQKNPYKGKSVNCINTETIPYKVVSWAFVRPDGGTPSVDELKKAIVSHGPVAACVKVTDSFQAYAGGIFDEYAQTASKKDVNHAITLVGWDDSKKAWLMKNSWGTEWGESGYMWIEYNCNNIGYGACWAVVEKQR